MRRLIESIDPPDGALFLLIVTNLLFFLYWIIKVG